jgi:hypothetical protein
MEGCVSTPSIVMMVSGERIAGKPGGSLSSISPGSPAAGRALPLWRHCSKAPVLLPGLKFQRSLRRKLHALLRLPQPHGGVGAAVVGLAGDGSPACLDRGLAGRRVVIRMAT